MTEDFEDDLALLIINNKNFSNAYNLCRILARWFDIINCSEIIDRIKMKEYIVTTYPVSKTLEHFALTLKGRNKIEQEMALLVDVLKEDFPDKFEFIEKLSS